MEKKLQVLQGYVDEVMHYLWDPIGVAGTPEARDEYDGYVPRVVSILMQGGDVSREIVDYLAYVESDRMGGVANRARAQTVAAALIDYRDWVEEKLG